MLRGSLLPFYSDDRPRKWKVAERLRWRRWKGALGAVANRQRNSTDNIKQFPRISSVVFSNQYGTDPASKQPSCFYGKQFPPLLSHV